MMRDFIGTFTAPGTGAVGVLGIELINDYDTGASEGVVRLEKRPYYEGGMTQCVIDMPATGEREALRFAGIWTKRGDFDGEGCNVTVSNVRPQAIPAPTLDETTNPADVEWGEVRSAVAAKDWRRAWEVVGTDHTGDATPGEAYIFGNARRLACVSAALVAWRSVFKVQVEGARQDHNAKRLRSAKAWRDIAPLPLYKESWQRIKGIAAWESSAAAQYVEPKAARARAWLAERTISTPRTVDGPFGGRAATIIIDDSPPVTGLFRNPFVPANLARAMTHGGGETYTMTVNGERQTYTVPASDASDMVDALCAGYAAIRGEPTARVASGNAAISPNPAPHGPTRRRSR